MARLSAPLEVTSVKVILLGLNHDLQWKDPTGHLRQIVADMLRSASIDLVAEEATGLQTTVAQRVACEFNKPWINIDMSKADRMLAGIDDALIARPNGSLLVFDPFEIIGSRLSYLPKEDGVREAEWLSRILKQRVDVVLCLCGLIHIDPFRRKLEETGCSVEQQNLAELPWFQDLYGKYSIIEENGERWCEIRSARQ
jgi:hypothetical protein